MGWTPDIQKNLEIMARRFLCSTGYYILIILNQIELHPGI